MLTLLFQHSLQPSFNFVCNHKGERDDEDNNEAILPVAPLLFGCTNRCFGVFLVVQAPVVSMNTLECDCVHWDITDWVKKSTSYSSFAEQTVLCPSKLLVDCRRMEQTFVFDCDQWKVGHYPVSQTSRQIVDVPFSAKGFQPLSAANTSHSALPKCLTAGKGRSTFCQSNSVASIEVITCASAVFG